MYIVDDRSRIDRISYVVDMLELFYLVDYLTTLSVWILYSVVTSVTCMGVRVTKITGWRSDDWIYWHFGYNLS
jgi:hypothetical protein